MDAQKHRYCSNDCKFRCRCFSKFDRLWNWACRLFRSQAICLLPDRAADSCLNYANQTVRLTRLPKLLRKFCIYSLLDYWGNMSIFVRSIRYSNVIRYYLYYTSCTWLALWLEKSYLIQTQNDNSFDKCKSVCV